MADVIALKTNRDSDTVAIAAHLRDLADEVEKSGSCAYAMSFIRLDGSSFVSTYGKGRRVQLLGLVTDLQYALSKSGDE